jgi:hypothetical protein
MFFAIVAGALCGVHIKQASLCGHSYESLSGKFTNSGQRIVLKDQSGAVVEELDATLSWFARDKATVNRDNVLRFEMAVRGLG